MFDTAGNDRALQQLIRYQFSNSLGSCCLELDDQAEIISYEEYTPYGSTSYHAICSQLEAPNRYCFTGKERDEEIRLCYHGARHSTPWLGRWTSCDPLEVGDGTNIYVYVNGSPVDMVDKDGKQGTTSRPKDRVEDFARFFSSDTFDNEEAGSDTAGQRPEKVIKAIEHTEKSGLQIGGIIGEIIGGIVKNVFKMGWHDEGYSTKLKDP